MLPLDTEKIWHIAQLSFLFNYPFRTLFQKLNPVLQKFSPPFGPVFWSRLYTSWTARKPALHQGKTGCNHRQGGQEMLVLGRNLNETIVIDGKIFIKIVRGKLGNGLKVAIEAPRDVSIVRGELFPGIEEMEAKWARALGPDR